MKFIKRKLKKIERFLSFKERADKARKKFEKRAKKYGGKEGIVAKMFQSGDWESKNEFNEALKKSDAAVALFIRKADSYQAKVMILRKAETTPSVMKEVVKRKDLDFEDYMSLAGGNEQCRIQLLKMPGLPEEAVIKCGFSGPLKLHALAADNCPVSELKFHYFTHIDAKRVILKHARCPAEMLLKANTRDKKQAIAVAGHENTPFAKLVQLQKMYRGDDKLSHRISRLIDKNKGITKEQREYLDKVRNRGLIGDAINWMEENQVEEKALRLYSEASMIAIAMSTSLTEALEKKVLRSKYVSALIELAKNKLTSEWTIRRLLGCDAEPEVREALDIAIASNESISEVTKLYLAEHGSAEVKVTLIESHAEIQEVFASEIIDNANKLTPAKMDLLETVFVPFNSTCSNCGWKIAGHPGQEHGDKCKRKFRKRG